MNIYATRSSVAAGDDVDAPHARIFSFAQDSSLEQIVSGIVSSNYLAMISGGRATWTVVSQIPLAVVAQEWEKPRMFPMIEEQRKQLDLCEGTLRIHFNYHGQIDPEVVYRIFWGFRLNAQ
jgi:hypothetical protein